MVLRLMFPSPHQIKQGLQWIIGSVLFTLETEHNSMNIHTLTPVISGVGNFKEEILMQLRLKAYTLANVDSLRKLTWDTTT